MIKKEEIHEGMWFTMDCNGFKNEDGNPSYMLKFLNPVVIKDHEMESCMSKILFHLKSYNPKTIPCFANTMCYRVGYPACFVAISIKDFRELGKPIDLEHDEEELLKAVEKACLEDDGSSLEDYVEGLDRNVDYVLRTKVFTEKFCKEYGFRRIEDYIKEVMKGERDFKITCDKWVMECEKNLPKVKKDLENIISNKMVGKSYYAEERPLISKDIVRFGMITKKMRDMYERKNNDYGNSFKDLYKECGMTYAYGHLSEKLARIKQLMKDEAKVKGESMKDSLYDLANYAILSIMELEREDNDKRKDIHRD